MPDMEGFRNKVERMGAEEVVFCVVCGQPEEEEREHLDCAACGHAKDHIPGEPCETCGETEEETRTITIPPQGYSPVGQVGNWHKVGDALCCSVRCALAESGFNEEHDEYHTALDATAEDSVLTPEQVAAMPAKGSPSGSSPVGEPQEFDPQKIGG